MNWVSVGRDIQCKIEEWTENWGSNYEKYGSYLTKRVLAWRGSGKVIAIWLNL